MGEPTKLVVLEKVIKIIKRDGLIEQTRNVGKELYHGLISLSLAFPDLVCLKHYFILKKQEFINLFY